MRKIKKSVGNYQKKRAALDKRLRGYKTRK